MPDDSSAITTIVMIIMPLMAMMLLLVLIVLLRVSARVLRLEQLLSAMNGSDREAVPPKRTELQKTEQTEFDKFIAEDSNRIALSKREQAAAFREWRRQRGVTWKADEV